MTQQLTPSTWARDVNGTDKLPAEARSVLFALASYGTAAKWEVSVSAIKISRICGLPENRAWASLHELERRRLILRTRHASAGIADKWQLRPEDS